MHRMTTMNLGACVGYTGTRRLGIGNKTLNRYNSKSFFDDKNYRWIIICLDDGYQISTDLIEYMQDYYDLLQHIIHRHSSYSNKWKSKLKQQSTLSSYHTTKRAQFQTIRSPEKLTQLIQSRCNAIQQVITTYKKQVDRMYPSERFGTVHNHYRSREMERLFKNARSSLSEISDKLDKLRKEEKKAQDALLQAQIQCQNETSSKNKSTGTNDHPEKRQTELQKIKNKITRTEEEFSEEREVYREQATSIYKQCRKLEEERLDQIRQTLIKFTEAVHSSEFSSEQDAIYDALLLGIKSEQDTQTDLDFWAQTYHVDILPKSISSEANQNDDLESQTTTTEENTDESETEGDESEDNESTADGITTST